MTYPSFDDLTVSLRARYEADPRGTTLIIASGNQKRRGMDYGSLFAGHAKLFGPVLMSTLQDALPKVQAELALCGCETCVMWSQALDLALACLEATQHDQQ